MRMSQTIDTGTNSHSAAQAGILLKPAGPSPAPILGWLLHDRQLWRDPIAYLVSLYEEYGVMSSHGSGPPRCVFSFAPECNKRLAEESDLFHWVGRRQRIAAAARIGSDSMLDLIRANIFTTWGDEYKRRAALIRPAFHHSWLNQWRDTMVAETEQAVTTWRSGEVRNVHSELNKLIHTIAMKSVLGLEDERLIDRIYLLETKVPRESFGTTLLPYDLPGTTYRRFIRSTTEIVAILRDVVARKRSQSGEATDMMGALVSARTEQGVGLSDIELVAEAYNLMHHSTTMSALMWTLILILQHPALHANLVDDLTGLLKGEAPTMQDLEQLPLLDHVVKESLRLLPPAAFGRRFTTDSCSFGAHELPAWVPIIFSSYITHRLPSIFPEPQRFRPSRWEQTRPTMNEYFPLGARVRHCVGGMFATIEIKIVLAILLQRFQLQIVPRQRIDRKPRCMTLLQPNGAIHMKVSAPQNRKFHRAAITGNLLEMVDFP